MSHPPTNPSDPHAHGEDHHGIGHVVSPKILIATATALLFLTVITVSAAKIDFVQLDLKELNIFVALAIAVVKASLVCLFFMHLRWDRPFNALVLVISLALVGLFIAFAMTDSTEYQHELVPGESGVIRAKLDQLPKVDPAAAPASGNAGH